jgi:5'-3' exonuclease
MKEQLNLSQEQVDFKSNSISPGTQFMIELNTHIQFFIQRKMHEDFEWRKLRVVFSGGSVPGEGEQKIVDYIRSKGPLMGPRDMHCIYGNDSDLILLGLKLHLPNLFVLKEPNVFVDKDRRTNHAAKRFEVSQSLEVIYVNVLREYLYLEFLDKDFQKQFREKFKGEWAGFTSDVEKNRNRANMERFIDDFVFLTHFVGNDFLPPVYGFSTKHGHLDLFIKELKKFYQKNGVFLIFREEILFKNLAILLKQLSVFQNNIIDHCCNEFRREITNYDKRKKMLSKNTSYHNDGIIMDNQDDEETDLFLLKYKGDYKELISAHGKLKKMVNLTSKPKQRKMFYYLNYFRQEKPLEDPKKMEETMNSMSHSFFEGLNFMHRYYSYGCPSWVWYYHHNLCPLLDDMAHFLENYMNKLPPGEMPFKLVQGSPFRPYIQLMHILPKISFSLLPKVFSETLFDQPHEQKDNLLSMETEDYSNYSLVNGKPTKIENLEKMGSLHRLKQCFPQDFEVKAIDNIRNYTWHPVVPHIQVADMLLLIQSVEWSSMSPQEQRRNEFGQCLLYEFDKTVSTMVEPTLPGFDSQKMSVKKREYDFEKEYEKDVRKIDRNYVCMEDMLDMTRFRSPSVLRRFGGVQNVQLKKTIKKKREICFWVVQAEVVKELLLNQEIDNEIDSHLDDIKESNRPKQKEKQTLKSKSIFLISFLQFLFF